MCVQDQSGSFHLRNNFCYLCPRHIKKRLMDERTLVTNGCHDSWNKTKLNNGAKKLNGWDFKRSSITMQAVIIIQFAIITSWPIMTDLTNVKSVIWPLTYAHCKPRFPSKLQVQQSPLILQVSPDSTIKNRRCLTSEPKMTVVEA